MALSQQGFIQTCSDQNSNPDLGNTSSDSQVEDDGDPENRLGNSHWWFCTGCCPMPRVVESLCCKEISALEDKLRNAEDAAKTAAA